MALLKADNSRARDLRGRRLLADLVETSECGVRTLGVCFDAREQSCWLRRAGPRVDGFLCVGKGLGPLAAGHGGERSPMKERIGLVRVLCGPLRLGMSRPGVSFGEEGVDSRDPLVGIVLLG